MRSSLRHPLTCLLLSITSGLIPADIAEAQTNPYTGAPDNQVSSLSEDDARKQRQTLAEMTLKKARSERPKLSSDEKEAHKNAARKTWQRVRDQKRERRAKVAKVIANKPSLNERYAELYAKQASITAAARQFSDVPVKGYFRKDGTYVRPHMRSYPDGNIYNNWSTAGNVNPYTGARGTTVVRPNEVANQRAAMMRSEIVLRQKLAAELAKLDVHIDWQRYDSNQLLKKLIYEKESRSLLLNANSPYLLSP